MPYQKIFSFDTAFGLLTIFLQKCRLLNSTNSPPTFLLTPQAQKKTPKGENSPSAEGGQGRVSLAPVNFCNVLPAS